MMAVPFTDNQQGYIDGLNAAKDAITSVKSRYSSGGMVNARAIEALDAVDELLEAAALKTLNETQS